MESSAGALATVAILFLVLSALVVVLRCYVRARLIKSFGPDDWTMVVAMLLYAVYIGFVLTGISHGTGQHVADLSAGQASAALKAWWCCELFYVACTAVLKVAIGIFLLRITVVRAHIYALWLTMAVSTTFGLAFFFVVLFQCSPVESFWNTMGTGPRNCIDPTVITNMTYVHAAILCVSDCTFAILPILLVRKLLMNTASKVSLGFILCLGAVGCIASFVRVKTIEELAASTDFLYSTVNLAIWSTVEPGVGITAASLATLRPLFRAFLDNRDSKPQSTRPLSMPKLRSNYHRTVGEGPREFGQDIANNKIKVTTTIRSLNDWDHSRKNSDHSFFLNSAANQGGGVFGARRDPGKESDMA
ncbi:hypothetical protein MMC19_005130 [Ptychographa xylographoides]|nr:hypothetical protein [Ptychographa xylographoides]